MSEGLCDGSNDSFIIFLWASFCCRDYRQISLTSSSCTRHFSRGWVSLNIPMAACKFEILRSMGIMAVTPYTKWKGVKLVDVFIAMWYAHMAEKSICCQLVLLLFTICCNIVLRTFFTNSTYPLDWG